MLSGLAEARATAAAVLDPLASTEQAERVTQQRLFHLKFHSSRHQLPARVGTHITRRSRA